MRNDKAQLIVLVAFLLTGFCIYFFWQGSASIGLDLHTGFYVLLRSLITIAVTGVVLLGGKDLDYITLGGVLPITIAFMWAAWWPALDFWAIHGAYAPDYSHFFNNFSQPDPIIQPEISWWDTRYTKGGIFISILGVGYFLKKVASDYY